MPKRSKNLSGTTKRHRGTKFSLLFAWVGFKIAFSKFKMHLKPSRTLKTPQKLLKSSTIPQSSFKLLTQKLWKLFKIFNKNYAKKFFRFFVPSSAANLCIKCWNNDILINFICKSLITQDENNTINYNIHTFLGWKSFSENVGVIYEFCTKKIKSECE